MASFFRRKKPGSAPSERRYSTEELAAAFPGAQQEKSDVEKVESDVPPARSGVGASDQPSAPTQPAPAELAGLRERRQELASAETAEPPAPVRTEPPVVPVPTLSEPAPAAPTPVETRAPTAPSVQPATPVPPPVPPVPSAPPVRPASDVPRPVETVATPAADADTAEPAHSASVAAVGRTDAPAKGGWRERLRGTAFARTFGGLFQGNPRLDDDLLDEIETALIIADVGVTATTDLVEDLRKRMKAREFADSSALLKALRQDLVDLLAPVAVPLRIDAAAKPFVVLTVGVNGVGKTTTIGKLARRFKGEGHSLMLAAGDTFRAAAVAQLQTWGERNGVPVIAQGQNADAASVAFDALQAAKARGTQVLIADTAGRLHTQQGLMAELGKIKRVMQKLDPAAPHEVLMVIDGTTGQNALSQLRQFHAAVQVTGLVVTKLDGTAKGGVVFALAREFGIPIRYAGIGEKLEDLRVFDAEAFVDALLPDTLGG
ncbi:signal recognition particle-docking protein FtsY [Lysobacter ciconiae]|uniref:Signal recognition particle receptor FtsY n=1 Tax=Novilysobacter ciconiae TaxID=2781022 RepID=A0A7S6UHL0_9GAMM|nr:signal recognition particle-docking protein FtsY [Lysobacter ciconiae]QOW20370.1 signal recognition particle-docking protein FtsY [Lysobacter ciconiae]